MRAPTSAWVARAAVVIAVAGLALRGWVVFRGYFLVDDFIFQARAAREPFLSNLVTEHAGHLMPGGMFVAWVATEAAPLNHTFVALLTVAAQAAAAAMCWRMLTTLVGSRPAVLAPFLFYCLTPLLLPSTAWWAAALNALPLQIAAFAAVTAYVRHRRTGSTREMVICIGATVGGLLFYEKAVLVPLVVADVALALSPEPRLARAVTTELRARWRLWASLTAVSIGYLGLYTATPRSAPFGSPDDATAVADLVSGSIGKAVAPSIVGGPWSWIPVGTAGGIGDAPAWAGWLAADLLLLLIVVTSLFRRRARRVWATLLVVAAADLAVLGISRLFIGPQIGQELRYFADLAVPAVIALTLALLTPLGERPDPLARRASAAVARRPAPARVVAAVVALAFVAGSVWSTIGYDRVWSDNPARGYVTTAHRELAELPPGAGLLDQPVPPEVLDGLTAPRNTTAWVFSPVRGGPDFGETATEGWQVTDDGHVELLDIDGVRSRPGPAEGCGWPVNASGGAVNLGNDLFTWPWLLRVEYLAGDDTDAVLHLGEGSQRVTFRKGLGTLVVRLTGDGRTLRVRGVDRGVGVCIDAVRVGTWTRP
jgi:hypothetical protein